MTAIVDTGRGGGPPLSEGPDDRVGCDAAPGGRPCQTGLIPEQTISIVKPVQESASAVMQVAQRQVLEDLRERIRQLERKPARSSGGVETGVPEVDAVLPGGFPRGSLAELVGAPGSGKAAVAAAAAVRAMATRGLAAWIDARGEVYAPALQAHGIDLTRLLIVRPAGDVRLPPSGAQPGRGVHPGARQALWAAEAVLGSGAFAAVIIDIPISAGARADSGGAAGASVESMLRRLVTAAEKGGAVALWLSEPGSCATPARVRLEVHRDREGVRVRPVRRPQPRGAAFDAA